MVRSESAEERKKATEAGEERIRIYTLGHSTLSIDKFLEILKHYQIGAVVDVRTIPRSRHNPQFNKENLSPFLRIRRIKYLHIEELGGLRRHVKEETRNDGWLNASFRGFADYMQTPAFKVAIESLIRIARSRTTAIICAEAVPWRCHRSLIADALVIRGIEVFEIFSTSNARLHVLTPMAEVHGTEITYPASHTGNEQSEASS